MNTKNSLNRFRISPFDGEIEPVEESKRNDLKKSGNLQLVPKKIEIDGEETQGEYKHFKAPADFMSNNTSIAPEERRKKLILEKKSTTSKEVIRSGVFEVKPDRYIIKEV